MSSNEGKGEIARVFRGSFDIRGFEDIEFNFQLLRSLGVVSYGGGTVGEILSIVPAIRPEEPETWVAQFKELAIRSKKLGLDLMQKGRMKSAHEAFFISGPPNITETRGTQKQGT